MVAALRHRDWIGVCTILISSSDGSTYRAVDQLMPAQALRQRLR
jgi:hypothetical protein